MTAQSEHRSWETLAQLIAADHREDLQDFIDGLAPRDLALSISRLEQPDQRRLLLLLGPAGAADVIEDMPEAQGADLIEQLEPDQAAEILAEVPSDQKVDLLGEMEHDEAESILEVMSPEEAADTRRLIGHDPDSAGGLMITEFLAYPDRARMGEVLADLKAKRREIADFSVQYIYVTGGHGELVGVLPVRDLVFADPDATAASVMIAEPKRVRVDGKVDELQRFFDHHGLVAAPVVDGTGRLVGVVREEALEEASTKRVTRHFLGFSGIVGGEEFRSMPFRVRSGRRLSWLSINIVLNVIAASVIAVYQDTLAAVITLAVFLPMITDMSGCSGNQAVAVSIRELTLGLVRPGELGRVLGKEITIGLINGLVLGLLLGGVAFAWKGNPWLGLVVGVALAANTVVAVCLGGLLPLVLQAPGHGSGPGLGPGAHHGHRHVRVLPGAEHGIHAAAAAVIRRPRRHARCYTATRRPPCPTASGSPTSSSGATSTPSCSAPRAWPNPRSGSTTCSPSPTRRAAARSTSAAARVAGPWPWPPAASR